MNFFIKMTCKRTYAACHYVNNRMRNMIFFDMFTASLQCRYVIINSLRRTNLRNINFKAVSIMKFKLMIINFRYTLEFILVHAAITISFAGNMIFNILLILVVFCKLIYECLIPAVSTQRFGTY